MNYLTVKEIAKNWNISSRRVTKLCEENRIEGSIKFKEKWVIPNNVKKPIDLRITSGKYIKYKKNNIYLLKHFDTTLLEFELIEEFDGLRAIITKVYNEHQQFFPLNLEVSDEGILQWLKRRTIPRNRAYVENFMFKLGLSEKSTKGIIDLCRGLSLNDCYWVPDKSFQSTFEEVNLYNNNFSNTLALIAFTGYGTWQKSGFTSSPEFTTNGMLAKCWRRVSGKIVLYKTGTIGARNTGNEPYSEYLAYQVAKAMGLDVVPYNLSKWKGSLCSTCELFTSIDQSFIPIGDLVKSGGIRKVMEYYKTLGPNEYNKLIDMLVFDSVICNTDRHFGNFGILVNSHSNKIIGMAPIFDNGLSLFCYALEDDINDLHEYAKKRTPANYRNFIELSKEVMTKRQKDQLRHLLHFKFKKHPRYNMDHYRMKQIEDFIQQRAKELLEE